LLLMILCVFIKSSINDMASLSYLFFSRSW
jgi:hypothetical protein